MGGGILFDNFPELIDRIILFLFLSLCKQNLHIERMLRWNCSGDIFSGDKIVWQDFLQNMSNVDKGAAGRHLPSYCTKKFVRFRFHLFFNSYF